MNTREHARLARALIAAAGGLAEAAVACRVSKSLLALYQDPNATTTMPADVIVDLEAYCGRTIYSRAMFEARPEPAPEGDLLVEACEVAEAAAELQRSVRLATQDGRLTNTERDQLARRHALLEAEMREVGRLLNAG